MDSLFYQVNDKVALKPGTAITESTAGSALDRLDPACEDIKLVINCGTISAGTFTVKLTECDTANGTYTDVDVSKVLSESGTGTETFTSTTDDVVKVLAIKPGVSTKRFLKPYITVSGTSPSGYIAATWQTGKHRVAPIR